MERMDRTEHKSIDDKGKQGRDDEAVHESARLRTTVLRPEDPATLLLRKESLVLVVRADPEPEEGLLLKKRERAVAVANSNGPQRTDFLEAQGWMTRARLPQMVYHPRSLLDLRWKFSVTLPEVRSCRGLH